MQTLLSFILKFFCFWQYLTETNKLLNDKISSKESQVFQLKQEETNLNNELRETR